MSCTVLFTDFTVVSSGNIMLPICVEIKRAIKHGNACTSPGPFAMVSNFPVFTVILPFVLRSFLLTIPCTIA